MFSVFNWALTFLERRIYIVFRPQGRLNISDSAGDQL